MIKSDELFMPSGLRRKIRNLESDSKEADEKILALSQAIHQYSETNNVKKPLKPFVSTVRSHSLFPGAGFNSIAGEKCGCGSGARKSGIHKEIEKLKSDLTHAEDLLTILRRQDGEKEREINRLQCLLVGGRPVSALAKDCCYKDVSKISEDVSVLQRSKLDLQKRIIDDQDLIKSLQRMLKELKAKNAKLESYIKEISNAALYVEREANLKIKNQNRDIADLKENLTLNTVDSRAQELKQLKKSLKEKNKQEQKLLFEVEYLKDKLKEHEQETSEKSSQLIAELVKDRDILQTKLKTLADRGEHHIKASDDCDGLRRLYYQLNDRETQIGKLKEEIQHLRCETITSTQHPASTLTMTNNIRRAECERDCALNKVQSMKIEVESLNDKIRVISDSKINENKRIIQLEETITKLKLEIRDLQSSKTPAFQTIKQLREENCELQIKLRSADEDYKKLNNSYNQVKMLSHQTESVLMTSQNQLEFTKCELSERESQICCLNKSNDVLKEQIEKLTVEISKLKTLKSTAEREKEFYMMSLDKKSEKLVNAESKAESATQLRDSQRIMKSQIE